MKTKHICSLIISLFTLTNGARAQQWSGGLSVELPFAIDRTGTTFRTSSAAFDMRDGLEANNLRPGLFVRYDRPTWFGQADGQYVPGFQLGFRASGARINAGSESAKGPQTALRFTGGYKPAPWLRLQAGLGVTHTAWGDRFYTASANQLEARINTGQLDRDSYGEQIDTYRDLARVITSYKPYQLTGHVGLGIDLGGITLDLMRTQGITRALNGVPGVTEAAQQNYGFYSLRAGYRLFPAKRFLVPKKSNRAYQRLQEEIPFYRNEFHLGLGNQAEDINAGIIYEARYTRFFTRRFGITGTASAARREVGRFQGSLTPANAFVGAVMARMLPLYTRRHQIALSFGPQISVTGQQIEGRFDVTTNPQSGITYGQLISEPARVSLGTQGQFDYQLAITDRLPVGVWLRSGNYGTFYGLQLGYRF